MKRGDIDEQKMEELKKKLSSEMLEYVLKKEAFEKELAEEYPFMRQGESQNTYDQWGLEIASGWYKLLHSLCAEISAVYEEAGQPVDIVIDQIKEKFGTLRFYWHPQGNDQGIHAIDFLGVASLRTKTEYSELHKEVREIVRKWEAQSAHICENCGAFAELRNDIGYHVRTFCDACYVSRKQSYDNHQNKLQQQKL